MSAWNWLDWTFVAIMLISVVTAARMGLVRELISLSSTVAGLIIAALDYHQTATWFEDLTKSHEIALGLGFLVIFLGAKLAGLVVLALASQLVKKSGVQGVDRLMGGGFGLVRGVIETAVLLMIMLAFSIKPVAIQESALAPWVSDVASYLAKAMPEELKTHFDKFREELVQKVHMPTPTPAGTVGQPVSARDETAR